MNLDWLLGKKAELMGNSAYIRSLVLEPETVREIEAMVNAGTGKADTYVQHLRVPGQVWESPGELSFFRVEPIDTTQLEAEPEWRLGKLVIHGAGFIVDLRSGVRPCIIYEPGEPEHVALYDQLIEKLYSEGRPRWRLAGLVTQLPTLAALLLQVAWWWSVFTTPMSASWIILGTLLAAAASAYFGLDLSQRLRARYASSYPGHRIRTMSRAEIRSKRADRHADLKVAIYTLPAGALLSAGAIWLFQVY